MLDVHSMNLKASHVNKYHQKFVYEIDMDDNLNDLHQL